MKKLLKALGLTALAAAVIPYRVRTDEEAKTVSVDALLWQLSRGPGEDEAHDQLDISLGFKSPFQANREERALFADDEPEAAVVDPAEPQTEANPGREPEAGPEEAGEADFDPEL